MDPRINEKFRKPRRMTGTPLNTHANIVAVGLLAFSGALWYLWENYYPPAVKLKADLKAGKFGKTSEQEEYIRSMRIHITDPTTDLILRQLRIKQRRKELENELQEETAKPRPCPPTYNTISKYFAQTETAEENLNVSNKEIELGSSSTSDSESPYRRCMSEVVKSTSLNDDDDFKMTKKAIVRAKSQPVPKKTVKPKKKPTKTQSNTLIKMTRRRMKEVAEDVDAEHLQMAIALSNSIQNEETSKSEDVIENSENLSKEKGNWKDVLEQFKSRSKGIVNRVNTVEIKSKSKKSKFRFITPTLMLRTSEEREELIAKKISEILDMKCTTRPKQNVNERLFSEVLEQFHVQEKNSMIFQETHKFYVDQLNLSPSKACCGHLLKNWDSIPGRDETPRKLNRIESPIEVSSESNKTVSEEIISSEKTNIDSAEIEVFKTQIDDDLIENPEVERISCTSPDLFESYREPEPRTPSPSDSRSFSPSLINLSPTKSFGSLTRTPEKSDFRYSNKSGINHYESFTYNNAIVVDLTQSEAEENTEELFNNSNNKRKSSPRKSLFPCSSGTLINESITEPFTLPVDIDSTHELNVTEYVNNLLKSDKISGETKDNKKAFSSESSQESIVISDDELNYSSVYATPAKGKEFQPKRISYVLSDSDEDNVEKVQEESFPVLEHNRISDFKEINKPSTSFGCSSFSKCLEDSFNAVLEKNSMIGRLEMENTEENTQKEEENLVLNETSVNVTPKTDVVIKTSNITPMMDYDGMNTPKIVDELNRFGLKPMKRQRGVKLLKYIYETTHPVINIDEEEDGRVVKRRRTIEGTQIEVKSYSDIKIVGDSILEGESMDSLIFERKHSVRIHSCRIPLQIVWYNFVTSNPNIYESILMYEPLQLEVLHNMLKEQGFKFNIQDLLSFLDKKCITIRTNQKGK